MVLVRIAVDLGHHGPMDIGQRVSGTWRTRLPATATDGIDWGYIRRRTAWVVPFVFLSLSAIVVLKYIQTPVWVGLDASLYAQAAAAWLAGSDPWAVSQIGIYFAAPPPTLLPFALFAWMPPLAVSLIWIVGSFVMAWLAVRALRLPIWWIAFPPIVDAALVGNPDVAVLAFLVCAGGRLGGLAPFFKIYAFIPMVGERRWREIATAVALLAVTALILPWGLWFSQLPVITGHLVSVSASTSVFGQPVLMAVAVVALLSLGLRRAGWLAVPILWPYTQFHYAAISVPGLTPYLALCWCFPTPEVWLVSTCVFAVYQRLIARPVAAAAAVAGIQTEPSASA